ncbi:redoxin domain-containing protein [bacterium]|nr:redoxin domain-containing protein [bacterium]MBU1637539.1 redoxin domain-containing protein [bacterium]
MKLHRFLYAVCCLLLAAGLTAAPRVTETTAMVHCVDIDSTIELSALSVNKQTSFINLNQATGLLRIQIIVPDELPLIVLATSAHCVPIFLEDQNSYLDYNGVPYVRTDSVASAVGCEFHPAKRSGGRLVCRNFHSLDSIGTEIGDKAPGFCLPNTDGSMIRSLDLLKQGNLVVAFIRSADWEPLSRDLLLRLNSNRENFQEAGAQIAVIHGYAPDVAAKWRDSLKVELPLLSDDVSAVMRAYGIHQMAQLPNSSVFVLDSEGVIRYKHVYGDEWDPPEMVPILEAVRALRE